MQKKKILITGTTGLLGINLVSRLEEEYEIHCFKGDVASWDDVSKYITKEDPYSWVIHCAAMTNVDECEKNQQRCYQVNVLGTKHMRDLALASNARFLYISSVAVFSGEEGNYLESDLPYPKNFYSLSKYIGEMLTREYKNGTLVRVNIIGVHPDGSRGQNFMEWLVDSVRINKDMTLFNDVEVNPLSPQTISELISVAIELPVLPSVLHFASHDVCSKADIGQLVIKWQSHYTGRVESKSIDSSGTTLRPKKMTLNTVATTELLRLSMPSVQSEVEKILQDL